MKRNKTRFILKKNGPLFMMLLMIFTISCNKDEIGPQPNVVLFAPDIDLPASTGFFIINEGNFGAGNSSLSYFRNDSGVVVNNYYQAVNGSVVGDTFQSMNKIGDNYYMVINNSGKVVVVDSSLVHITTIDGLESPRYVQEVSGGKIYVTDLFSDEISVINIDNNAIVSTIQVSGWTEKMLLVDGMVFVQENDNSKILVIDSSTDQVVSEIQLSVGISEMVLDNNSSLWVLCNGGYLNEANPKLHQVNTFDYSITQSFEFASDETKPNYLTYNATDDLLYYFQDGVRSMAIDAESLPAEVLIPDEFNQQYGLDYNDYTNEILIIDAIDYASQGKVFRYSAAGVLLEELNVGVNPNGVFIVE